jgi:ankyrin repeat protein
MLRALIAAGAFKDAPYQMREDALRAAIAAARPDTVRAMLAAGADVHARDVNDYVPLAEMFAVGALRGKNGSDVVFSLDQPATARNSHADVATERARHDAEDRAYAADRLEVLRLMLAAGSPVPEKAMLSARNANEIRMWLAAGANLEARDSTGDTALQNTDDQDLAIALLEAGADRNTKDEEGNTFAAKVAKDMPRVRAWLAAHPAAAH